MKAPAAAATKHFSPGYDMLCNCCGGAEFAAKGRRPGIRCTKCHAVERTRALRLVLEALDLPKPASRVLHFAPEYGLHEWLRARAGAGYDPVDFSPSRYKWAGARKMDLTTDAEGLKSETYDLILHSHVMEHIPCNTTAVLYHLHRALKPDGMQVCCIPFLPGRRYEESLEPLSEEVAAARFGQRDHVRVFGALDAERTIGMVFNLPDYDIRKLVPEADLMKYNIPEYAWTGLSQHTILVLRKDDLKLRM